MRYLQKSFNVYLGSIKEISCQKCQRTAKAYICSQKGYLCFLCYEEEKTKEIKEKIERISD